MEHKVRLFLDGKMIEPSDYQKICIKNEKIDMIINSAAEREMDEEKASA